jgi:hypothetical protein
MDKAEYDKERAIAAMNPVRYIRSRAIFRLDEGQLPESLKEGWCRFWLFGIWPGSFLSAVIRNDLTASISAADDQNLRRLVEIVQWFYCYGDTRALKDNAERWAKRGGYFGGLRKEVSDGS